MNSGINQETDDFLWPEPGDNLVDMLDTSPPSAGRRNACVNLNFLDQQHLYISGYADAARVLIEHALKAGRDQDILIYPILFLSHHHVELALKKTLDVAYELYRVERAPSATHNLLCLWQDLNRIAKEHMKPVSGVEEQRWRAVGQCVRQLNALGAASEAFRYPVNKEGRALSLKHPHGKKRELPATIDLLALSTLMSKIANFFEGLTDMLSAELDARREMEQERGP